MELERRWNKSSAAITCTECGILADEPRSGWVSVFADTDAGGEVQQRVFFCPSCAELDPD
jgi:hypothetical protein